MFSSLNYMLALDGNRTTLPVPLRLFGNQARLNRRLIEGILKKLDDEPLAYYEACPIRYHSEVAFDKTPFWPWSKDNISYHATRAHILMHANAILVLGYRLLKDAEAFAPPFYISLNENPGLQGKLTLVKKMDFISLQSIGRVMEVEFADPNHPAPILLAIKELDLDSRNSRRQKK
jgi:hypothetical protein